MIVDDSIANQISIEYMFKPYKLKYHVNIIKKSDG